MRIARQFSDMCCLILVPGIPDGKVERHILPFAGPSDPDLKNIPELFRAFGYPSPQGI
jgi:hypothetical protein